MAILRNFGLLIVLSCLFGFSISAQESEITINNLQDLTEVLGEDFDLRWASISPTGSTIVWATWSSDTKLCQYQIVTEIKQCLDYREEGFGSFIRNYTWSPDGQYIAFTETINDRGFDSDVWVYELDAHQIINLTDDGVGQFYDEQPQGMLWDAVPTWNPATGELYFFRVELATDWERIFSTKYISQKLIKINLANGHIEVIRDLSNDLILGGTLQHPPIRNFEGTTAISSDGRYMVVANSQNRVETPPYSGLWIIDLQDDEEPYMLVQLNKIFSTGEPINFESSTFTFSLEWISHDSAILVFMQNSDGSYLSNLFYIPIDDNPTIIPLLDLSALYMDELDDIDSTTGYSWEFLNPVYAVVLQDSTTVMVYYRNFTDSAFALISLPITDETSLDIFYTMQLEPLRPQEGGRATVSRNGFVLMGGVLFEIEQISDN